jgi:hypothetical protein
MRLDLTEIIERAKREILYDVEVGIVPATCASFSELHDYVDANGYGGAFECDFDPTETDFWNAVQDAVDLWIKAGRPQYRAAWLAGWKLARATFQRPRRIARKPVGQSALDLGRPDVHWPMLAELTR